MSFKDILTKYAGHPCIMSKKDKPVANVYVFDIAKEAKADRETLEASYLDGSEVEGDDSLVPFGIMLGSEDELKELMQENKRKRLALGDAMGSEINGVLLYSKEDHRAYKLDDGSVDTYAKTLDLLSFELNDKLEEVVSDDDEDEDDDDDEDEDEEGEDD
jgi:hypothetical protein